MRNRLRAGLIHLCLSAVIAALVFLPIYFFWFPDVLYETAGGRDLFLLVVSVDVTLGPLITTIIFVPGKWGLKFDLIVIGTLQLAALGYGVYTLFEARPVYFVFVKDRFEMVRANEFPAGNLESAPGNYGSLSFTGPKLIGAKIPTNLPAGEQFDLIMSGIAGVDVSVMPRFYVPYEEVRSVARQKGEPMQKLRDRNPGKAADVDALIASTGRKEADLRFLPMRAGKTDLTVVIDPANGNVLKISSVKPWGDI